MLKPQRYCSRLTTDEDTGIPCLELNAKNTALVVIDLQEGILPFAGGPHRADEVVARAARLADECRRQGSPGHHGPRGLVGRFRRSAENSLSTLRPGRIRCPKAGGPTRPRWVSRSCDIEVTKRQWGAFDGTDLELQLRRRGIDTIILCGISTNIGVESTARNAWELGFNLVIAEDACSAASAEQHQGSMTHIFPRIGRVRSTEEILTAL